MCPATEPSLTSPSLTSRAARAVLALADEVAATARAWGAGIDSGRGDGSDVEPWVAATALLLEVANVDARFSTRERAVVECTLHDEYGLGPVRTDRLVRAAERARRRAPGPWVFTSVLVARFTRAQRERFAQILERLLHADGEPGWQERYTVDKLHALLRVEVAGV